MIFYFKVHKKSIILQMLLLVYLVKDQKTKIKNHIKLIFHQMKKINQILKSLNVKNLNFVIYTLIILI